MGEIPNWFVVCMGVGTVFVGLICIIVICKIMSAICGLGGGGKKPSAASAAAPAAAAAPAPAIENRQEILAAVTAVCAEEMGADVSAVRVLSFKKL